jgi:ribosomal protein S18 acetylase RimI-like enzyme
METISLPTRNKGQASQMLARAFHEDPLYQHIFPDGQQRARSLERLFSAVVGYSLRYGQVQTTPSLEGAVCWLTPDNTVVTFWRMLRSGLAFQRAVGRMPAGVRQELLDALAFTDTIHKRLMAGPHWYLWALGVDPDYQGRGIGGALIRPALVQADGAGLPCYLETLNESNLAFYQKWGFEVREEETVPELGLPIWAMVRQPRP